jgi:site-specific recombinase XerD
MKPFESFLAEQLEHYLAYRQSRGYALMPARSYLLRFDQYLRQTKADWDSLMPAFFLQMRSALDLDPRTINTFMSAVRVFLQFLVRRGYSKENPLRDIPPLQINTVVPFIFSPEQVDQLLTQISSKIRKTKGCFLTDLAIYLAIVLLARCGMRISEPIGLRRQHYRPEEATVYIERTKFKKDRLIPVPKRVITQIENYLSVRQALKCPDDNPYLLAGRRHKPLSDSIVRYMFHDALKDLGWDQPRRLLGNVTFKQPSPHSLRHAFAVNTLQQIKARGQSPQNALPILAAYMGHVHYMHTSVYLRVANAQSRKNLVDFALWQTKKK